MNFRSIIKEMLVLGCIKGAQFLKIIIFGKKLSQPDFGYFSRLLGTHLHNLGIAHPNKNKKQENEGGFLVFGREFSTISRAMIKHAAVKVVGHAGIKRSMFFGRQDIHKVMMVAGHGAYWLLSLSLSSPRQAGIHGAIARKLFWSFEFAEP